MTTPLLPSPHYPTPHSNFPCYPFAPTLPLFDVLYMGNATQTVDMQLAGMVETLKSLVSQVNSSSSSPFAGGGGGGGGGGDAGGDSNARKIVRILNAHHHSLAWLEDSSKKMLLDASDVSRRMGMSSDAALMPP